MHPIIHTIFRYLALGILLLSSIEAAVSSNLSTYKQVQPLPLQIIEIADHNAKHYTQGWIKDNNTFYESSGLYKRSFVTAYHDTMRTTRHIPAQYFAEGLTLLNNQLFLLTWKEETLLILDKNTLQTQKKISYQGEGWGLTHNGQQLIMSNGTSQLLFRKPSDFSVVKSVNVKGLSKINELEYVNGIIWANRWQEDTIYGIHPTTGCIAGHIDLSSLRTVTRTPHPRNVLNGIAYDKEHNGLWVTGKFWPKRYLIALPDQSLLLENNC